MPNRIIKESACTSDTLAEISADAERLWWRLVVQADDYGCFDGRPNVILGKCLTAFVGRFTEADVLGWLDELEQVELVERYCVNGKPYLHLTTWGEHQRPPRSKAPKYPPPSEADDTCQHMPSNDSGRRQVTASDSGKMDGSAPIDGSSRANDDSADICRQMTANAPVIRDTGYGIREAGGGRARDEAAPANDDSPPQGGAPQSATAAEMIGDDSVTPQRFYEVVNGQVIPSTVDFVLQEFESKLQPSALKWGMWDAKLNEGRGAKYLRSIYLRLVDEGLTTAEKAEEHERSRRERPTDRASPGDDMPTGLSNALRSARARLEREGGADRAVG